MIIYQLFYWYCVSIFKEQKLWKFGYKFFRKITKAIYNTRGWSERELGALFSAAEGLAEVVSLSEDVYSIDGEDNFPKIHRRMVLKLSEASEPTEVMEEPVAVELPEARIQEGGLFRHILVRVGIL